MKNTLTNKIKIAGLITGLSGIAVALSGCNSYEVSLGESWHNDGSYASLRKCADNGNNIGICIKKIKKEDRKNKPDFYYK